MHAGHWGKQISVNSAREWNVKDFSPETNPKQNRSHRSWEAADVCASQGEMHPGLWSAFQGHLADAADAADAAA